MTTATTKPALDAPSSSPPRRRFFDLENQTETSEAPVSSAEPAAAAPRSKTSATSRKPDSVSSDPATPTPQTGAIGKKRGPKPSPEPLENFSFKAKPGRRQQLDEMLADAPRHVLKQDLMEFILADFFERHPTLPEALRKRKARSK